MTSIGQPQPTNCLDILVVLAESWKVLLLAALLTGLFGFGILQMEPPTYQSTAKLAMLDEEGAGFSSDLVSEALKSVPAAPALNEVLAGLQTGDSVKRSSRSSTVSVSLALTDQKLVQPTLNAILRQYQKQYVRAVQDNTRSDLGVQIDGLSQEIAANAKAIDRLEKLTDLIVSKYGDSAAPLASIGRLEARTEELELQKRTINRRSALLADFLVSAKPSPAVKVAGSRILTVMMFAVLAAIAMTAIFLFMRERVRSLAKIPGEAEKIRRIQRAFGFHSRLSA